MDRETGGTAAGASARLEALFEEAEQPTSCLSRSPPAPNYVGVHKLFLIV